jgi:hypothetical protein
MQMMAIIAAMRYPAATCVAIIESICRQGSLIALKAASAKTIPSAETATCMIRYGINHSLPLCARSSVAFSVADTSSRFDARSANGVSGGDRVQVGIPAIEVSAYVLVDLEQARQSCLWRAPGLERQREAMCSRWRRSRTIGTESEPRPAWCKHDCLLHRMRQGVSVIGKQGARCFGGNREYRSKTGCWSCLHPTVSCSSQESTAIVGARCLTHLLQMRCKLLKDSYLQTLGVQGSRRCPGASDV